MYKRTVTLSNIMDSWKGEEVVLIVQGSNMKPFLRESEEPVFNQTANPYFKFQKLKNGNNHAYLPNSYQSEPECVVRDHQGFKRDRVSLAELGEFYSNKVMKPELGENRNKKLVDNMNENGVLYESEKGISFGKSDGLEKSGNKIKNRIMKERDNKEQIVERNQILKYVEGMTLPFNENTLLYNKAKENFQTQKQFTLENISQAQSLEQIETIILQFKTFTEKLILELDSQKKIVKNKSQSSFSFNEEFNLEGENIGLNKVNSKEDSKIEIINFEQFEDDAKSISSIKSVNENGVSDSEQKICRQQNVIQIAEEFKIEDNVEQQKPLENKDNTEPNQHIQPENTNFNTLLYHQNIPAITENTTCPKEHHHNAPIQNSNSRLAVEFEKLTKTPVKIIRNLEEAQQFDPSVVKFTEYKVKYIETRRITPEIVRIHSPYKAKTKEERIIKPQIEVNFEVSQRNLNKN